MSEAKPRYPFSAVVGQDDYKLALLANAVDPLIGGVLAVGERGTAKSTLARAFAAMLDGDDAAPFVELPLGATIDRLTGSLDTAKLLAGEGAELLPGLLAAADGGVLYADEVNLLADHLVDVLLDAAAFGVVRVERDGLSAQHDSRFLLVGTMNPEEGALRPQLLDRFGLSVRVDASRDHAERADIVARRIAYEQQPRIFADRFGGTEQALREILAGAREAVGDVELPDDRLATIAEICVLLDVEGMRADIVVARTAIALAALDRRDSVIDRDIETAARLALPHRARTTLAGEGWIGPERIQQAIAQTKGGVEADRAEAAPMAPRPRTPAARRDEAAPTRDIHLKPPPKADSPTGRGARGSGGEKPAVDAIPATGDDDLDVIATARAAVTRRLVGGDSAQPPFIESDLRERVRSGREANLVLCVVDASSSVLENGRGGELRALLGGLVADAKRKRDRVGLIVFRGREARLVAPPSRNHAAVLAGLDTVEPGGTTPLAEGIRVAHETAMRELRRNPDLKPIVTLVTDGYANIARGGGDALGEARLAAHDLKRAGVTLVVVGETSSGAPDFARQTGAEFYPFDPVADQRHIA